MAVSFFIDLQFAFQIHGFFPQPHYINLLNNNSQFSHYGIDFKYYLNKQYLKETDLLNPYLILGPFWLKIAFKAPPGFSEEEVAALENFTSFGAKLGFGLEVSFVKNTFLGVELSYLLTNLQFENQDLFNLQGSLPAPGNLNTKNLITLWRFPPRPNLNGQRFYGDLFNLIVLIGLNF